MYLEMKENKMPMIREVWVDKETGVNYVFHASGNAGGFTPLLGHEGKPVVSPVLNR